MSRGRILDGKLVSKMYRERLRTKVKDILAKLGIKPGLALICVGENPASALYIKTKARACDEVGINSFIHKFPITCSEAALVERIHKLNSDARVHGILVQLPLPPYINIELVLNSISPSKDVDGFHPLNTGRLLNGKPHLVPCTPKGIMLLLDYYKLDVKGKHAVILGRSNIVGKPTALMLMQRDATVTVCNSNTTALARHVGEADILIAAVGKQGLVSSSMVKSEAIVVDVGINRKEGGGVVGDVDFNSVSNVASWITPVPGGVGPMTVACLIGNTVEAFENTLRT